MNWSHSACTELSSWSRSRSELLQRSHRRLKQRPGSPGASDSAAAFGGKMRRILIFALLLIGLMTPVAFSQQLYTHDKVEYTFELPSALWKSILEPDGSHPHPEFVYGDRLDGYLTIRKEVVDAGTTASALARRDQDLTLRFLPGFVEGKEERFAGKLEGVTIAYE